MFAPLFAISLLTLAAYGVAGLSLLAAPILLVVVGVLLYNSTKGQTPSKTITSPGLQTQVDLGIFSGLFDASRANDRARVLLEVEILARRAGEAGGMESLMEQMAYKIIERKLATPGQRTVILSGLAKMLGTSERDLLNLAEGKHAPPPGPSSVSPATVVAPLVALVLVLLAASDGYAAPRLTSPQRFYAAESEPVVDPPTFRTAVGQFAPNGDTPGPLLAPQGVPSAPYTSNGGRRGIWPFRWLRCR